jgi:integrase
MVPADTSIPTYTIFARHSASCPNKSDASYLRCNCKKWIRVYDPRIADPKQRQKHFLNQNGQMQRSPFSAKTRSADDAEKIRQALKDSHDPDKVKIKQLEEANKRRDEAEAQKTVTIEEAVGRFLQYEHDHPRRTSSRRSGKAASKTMGNYHGLIGKVIQEGGAYIVKRPGRLFSWLNTLNPRPLYISDVTETLADKFMASWNAAAPGLTQSKPLNDLTTLMAFKRLKTFFGYCKTRGKWISQNPLDGVSLPTIEEGYRTAPFTDAQYDSIVRTIKNRYPTEIKNLEDQKQHDDAHRVLAIIELMRWGGLALADAVQFELSSLKNGSGHVTYRRVKTNTEAEPTLLPRVVSLLREVVPIDADPNRPFYDKDIKVDSNRGRWSIWIKALFTEAGIVSVETELRDREPHAHMLRDTFAVGQMRTQKKLGIVDVDGIAKAMGDSAVTVRKHYAPWVKELEDAHREMQQRIVDAQDQEEAAKQPQQPKVRNIIGGRK